MVGVGKRSAAVVLLVAGLALSACTSGGSGRPGSNPSESSGGSGSSSAVQSVPVPADVPKDSIRDLNSTKDMTGVVTTIPEKDSPYVGHLPPACEILGRNYLKKELGAASVSRPMNGRYINTCNFVQDVLKRKTGSMGMFTETIQTLVSADVNYVEKPEIILKRNVKAFQMRNKDISTPNCIIAWGTFYGAADVIYGSPEGAPDSACKEAVRVANLLIDQMPSSPSEMRRRG